MGVLHHIGTFLLFAAAVLLLVASISAPVINNIAMLKVQYSGSQAVTFGTFGHCVLGSSGDQCSGSHIGYNPLAILKALHTADYSNTGTKTSHALTNVQVLHPVGCGLAFLAFLTAAGSAFIGSLIASALAFLAWLVTVVVMATDFVAWGIVKDQVNDHKQSTGGKASWGVAMWLVLAAMVALFFGMILVLFACCSSRRKNKRTGVNRKSEAGYVDGGNVGGYRKKHFWQRKTTTRTARY